MDKLELIRTFVAICENGSVKSASSQLGVDGSRVSQRLKMLEDDLGVRLINRTTRAMSVTEAGQSYLGFGQRTLKQIANFEDELRSQQARLHGEVVVAAPPFFAARLLAPIISEIQTEYPDIAIVLSTNTEHENLISEDIDIAIRGGTLPDSRFVARPIYSGAQGIYASRSYLERFGTPSSPDDLSTHRFLMFRGRPTYAALNLERGQKRWTYRPAPDVSSNELSVLMALALNGRGIITVSDWVPAIMGVSDRLEKLLPGYDLGPSELNLLYTDNAKQRKSVAAVLAVLETHLIAHFRGQGRL